MCQHQSQFHHIMLRWYQNGWEKWFSCLFSSAIIVHFADLSGHKSTGGPLPLTLCYKFPFSLWSLYFKTVWSQTTQCFSSKRPRCSKFLSYSPFTHHMQSVTPSVNLLIFIWNKRRVWDSVWGQEHAHGEALHILSTHRVSETLPVLSTHRVRLCRHWVNAEWGYLTSRNNSTVLPRTPSK